MPLIPPPFGRGCGRCLRALKQGKLDRRRGDDAASGLADHLGGRGVRVLDHQGLALVGVLTELARERHLGEQGHVELVGEQLAAALAEDRDALAVGAGEGGHVLDHAEHLEIDLGGHLGGAAGDALRGRLGRGDDRDLCLRKQLGERHRDVAGAGWQVEQQVVELLPGHVLEELLDRLVEHRAAPDDGRVLLDEEADRHHRRAGRGDGRDDLALRRDLRLLVDAEHSRDRVAVDVAVERARLVTLGVPARQRGWRSSSTCRPRPCRRRRRSRSSPGPARPRGACGRPSFCCRSDFSPSERTSKPTPTVLTPSSSETCWTTAFWKWERIGHPGVVSETTTSTRPSSWMSIERTIPSSTIERRSSGSMTWVSFSVIWSLVGTVAHCRRGQAATPARNMKTGPLGPGFRGRRGCCFPLRDGRVCAQQASPGAPPLEGGPG